MSGPKDREHQMPNQTPDYSEKEPDPLLKELLSHDPPVQPDPRDVRDMSRHLGLHAEQEAELLAPWVKGWVPIWFPARDPESGEELSEDRRAELFHEALEWALGDLILPFWDSLSETERAREALRSLLLIRTALATGGIPIPGLS